MAATSELTNTLVVDVNEISEAIRSLGVITCDICKTGKASYDVFTKGVDEVAFIKRYCNQCIKTLNGSRPH